MAALQKFMRYLRTTVRGRVAEVCHFPVESQRLSLSASNTTSPLDLSGIHSLIHGRPTELKPQLGITISPRCGRSPLSTANTCQHRPAPPSALSMTPAPTGSLPLGPPPTRR